MVLQNFSFHRKQVYSFSLQLFGFTLLSAFRQKLRARLTLRYWEYRQSNVYQAATSYQAACHQSPEVSVSKIL